MTFDGDELAGMVDPFGALARAELRRAATEVAFRRGETVDEAAVAAAIDDAVDAYRLVDAPADAVDTRLEAPLVVGPTAFPASPDGAEDLPHLLDADRRSVDRAAVGHAVVERLRGEAARAVDRGDEASVRRLLDVTYDVESWAPVDVSDVRERFDSALE